MPESFSKIIRKYSRKIRFLNENKYRALIVISGSSPEKLCGIATKAILYFDKAYHRVTGQKEFRGLYIYHDEFPDAQFIRECIEREINRKGKYIRMHYNIYEKSEKYLGSTFELLVMDLTKDLKPNDLGRLINIVRGGGLVILLTPPWDTWDKFMTIFKRNLLVPGFDEPRHIFISWIKRKLLSHNNIAVYDTDNERVVRNFEFVKKKASATKKIKIPKETLFPREIYELALTHDQVNVIRLMEELYEKPRRKHKRVLVVTADRGRGKSCAVALGSVGLIHVLRRVKPKPRILVTAPSPSNVQSFMELAIKALKQLGYEFNIVKREGRVIELRGERFSIEYWEPLKIPSLRGDIVVVDEAAGIHVPMLHKIWMRHDRLVFATTIHGYEGAGRGFSVRFMKRLEEDKYTTIRKYEMEEPIRYSRDDPIEKWLFDALLLDAEPDELDENDLRDIEEQRLEYVAYDPQYLFSEEGEDKLRSLFGIYVLAHYRNEPDDLGRIADAPHHVVRAIVTGSGKIVCALQLSYEGRIDDETIDELLRGGKIPGNIIPDRFLKHVRVKEFAKMYGWRIVRIATHPDVQGRGIGTWALRHVVEEARRQGLDWVGAGFGATAKLLRFWLRNGFYPIHISPDRNPVSGEYTVLVVHPVSEGAVRLVDYAHREFIEKLINSLPITYSGMEVDVAYTLLSSIKEKGSVSEICKSVLSPVQRDRLWIYCRGPMTFEAASDIMFKLARTIMSSGLAGKLGLTDDDALILVGKALQGKEWEVLAEELGVKSKRLMDNIRGIACKLFERLYGDPEDYVPGIELKELDVVQ